MFGPKVIGDEAFAKQQQKEKGGSAFGPRVRDDLPGQPPKQVSAAQAPGAATQHGKRIEKSEGDGSLAVVDFIKILDDNSAFLDTLYIQELERVDGPRRECLLKVREVAIKLANRQDVIAEIDTLLADMATKAASPSTGAPAAASAPAASTAGAENTLTEAERVKLDKDAKIAHVKALDNFEALKAIAADLGLPVPKSKKAAKDSILAKLAE